MFPKLMKWTMVTYLVLTFLIALPAFNWMYITNHSYPRWLSSGLYRASARALVWPVFIRDLQNGPVARLKRTVDLTADADELTGGWDPHQLPSPGEWSQVRGTLLEALAEARHVDAASLEALYPGLGTHFEMEYLRGLECISRNPKLRLDAEMVTGLNLMDLWSKWFYANRDSLERTL